MQNYFFLNSGNARNTVAASEMKLNTIINTPNPENVAIPLDSLTKPIVINCETIENKSAPAVAAYEANDGSGSLTFGAAFGRIVRARPASDRIIDKIISISTGTNCGLGEPAIALSPIKLVVIVTMNLKLMYASSGPNAAQTAYALKNNLSTRLIIAF